MVDYQPAPITGSFTGSGQSSGAVNFFGVFSVFLGGTFSATVEIERSPDGSNWYPCSTDATGTVASYTAPMSVDVNATQYGILYRLTCTGYTSGTINYVMWQGSQDVAV